MSLFCLVNDTEIENGTYKKKKRILKKSFSKMYESTQILIVLLKEPVFFSVLIMTVVVKRK